MLGHDDQKHCRTEPEHQFLRPGAEQQQDKEHAAERKLHPLPVEENPVVLFARIPAQDDPLVRPSRLVQLSRSRRASRSFQKSIDSLKILRHGDIGQNPGAEPRAQQKTGKPTILDHVRIVANAFRPGRFNGFADGWRAG